MQTHNATHSKHSAQAHTAYTTHAHSGIPTHAGADVVAAAHNGTSDAIPRTKHSSRARSPVAFARAQMSAAEAKRQLGDIRPIVGLTFVPAKEQPGLAITAVKKGLSAESSGLQNGDIIKRLNGIAMKERRDYFSGMSKVRAGDTVKLQIERDGLPASLELLVGGKDHTDAEIAALRKLAAGGRRKPSVGGPVTPRSSATPRGSASSTQVCMYVYVCASSLSSCRSGLQWWVATIHL